VWVAPKQNTYELERQLLESPEVPGYTRLHILSFERLAHFVLDGLGLAVPDILNEEGRVMVMRGLLASARNQLRVFRASARLTGFAQQLSELFSELQRNQLTPDALCQAATRVARPESLALKLQDFATLLNRYMEWLGAHRLQDSESLLATAAAALEGARPSLSSSACPDSAPGLRIEHLWVDGFAEMAPQERELLAQLLPYCESATITFCLEALPQGKAPRVSNWSVVRRSFEQFKARLQTVPGADVTSQTLQRDLVQNRFANSPALARVEQEFDSAGRARGPLRADPQRTASPASADLTAAEAQAVRLVTCANPESEVVLAAREIIRHVGQGGRFREATVLLRNLEPYYLILQRVFARYQIPLFVDHREVVSHHPLPELTRSALRTVTCGWRHEDWFSGLKTGLVPARQEDLDLLENAALAQGWGGSVWLQPLTVADDPEQTAWARELQRRVVPPFKQLALALGGGKGRYTGPELARPIADFWSALEVEQQLHAWAVDEVATRDSPTPVAVHATVWEQMNAWLDNVELGFPEEALSLREWLPILEAGLGTLTVGLIPSVLDQVLVGTIDRSRNPQSKLVLVLGVNEGVFPARPQPGALLTDSDRTELERQGVLSGDTARHHLTRERYYAYVAWTRARERLIITCAAQDGEGTPLNPSPFFSDLARRFPDFPRENFDGTIRPSDSIHPCELTVHLLRRRALAATTAPGPADLEFTGGPRKALPPEMVEALYGRVLRTSVSRIEEYASCPFQFFMRSGLKAEERKKFELDAREQGSFQHDVLAVFHQQLQQLNLRWRDITTEEARQRIAAIGDAVAGSYGHGLLQASDRARFLARVMTSVLQDFVATVVGWMREQYEFDPVAVEWPFGRDEAAPAWTIDLDGGHGLQLQGRIDRIDAWRPSGTGGVLCVVIDYKSGQKKLDPLLVSHGIQLQLLTYLNVLRRSPAAAEMLGAGTLVPAGAFYVSLAGKYTSESTRLDALSNGELARRLAYRHTGRFDRSALPHLDSRKDVKEGDQFNFRITESGEFNKSCVEPMTTGDFVALLDSTEEHIKRMGREIFAGRMQPAPYRRGATTPCKDCSYQAVCRIDTWTHTFRVLRKPEVTPRSGRARSALRAAGSGLPAPRQQKDK
jgi:ATP-dependent helicase/nuclease subunit B